MKSAYELAMERLSKSAPEQKLTAAQKAELAELDAICKAKVAGRELATRDSVAAAEAAGEGEKADQLRAEFAAERARLEAERDRKKDRVRAG